MICIKHIQQLQQNFTIGSVEKSYKKNQKMLQSFGFNHLNKTSGWSLFQVYSITYYHIYL